MRFIASRLGSVGLRARGDAPASEGPQGLDDESGGLAARLVRGFEAQGSGWFWETDRHGRVTYLSDKVAEQLGGSDDPPVGKPLTELFEMGETSGTAERTLVFQLNARASFVDHEVRAVAGGERCWSITGRPWFDDLGQFRGFVGSGCDLTDKRRSEAEIAKLAMFDSLTGLANRARMRLSLGQALARSPVSYRPTALLLLDLDRFKAVNDTLGHQTGDQLLQQVAQRLKRAVGDAGLVGRVGGDEFKVIVPGGSNRETLAELARTIIDSLSQPYGIGGAHVSIGCSIGIAVAPEDGDDPETLTRNADLALYAAKADGRGVHRFFRASLLEQAQNRKEMEDELRYALARGQLRLVYQPIVSTATTQVVGYETLLRWDHPVRGPISPADFIPVAEETGLIEPIGEWVLRTACLTAATWPAPVRIAVNVSPIQFARQSLPAVVAGALAASGLEPERLELEITESVFLDGSHSTDQMFRSLKGLGVRLALDDFGTGYSSLGYLRTAPFDKIKIDQSFVRGARDPGSRNAAIIKAIVTLADTLGLETTAEGVEAQDEVALIRELGCSHIQGFVYGGGVPADQVTPQLSTSRVLEPIGVRVSRPVRTTMLRQVTIACGGRQGTARVRNISVQGAMIDAIVGVRLDSGQEVAIDLLGQRRAATVRWVREERAGLRFHEDVELTPRR